MSVVVFPRYTTFFTDHFGADTAGVCAKLFLAVDGTATGKERSVGKLPRGGQRCCGGPMQPTPVRCTFGSMVPRD